MPRTSVANVVADDRVRNANRFESAGPELARLLEDKNMFWSKTFEQAAGVDHFHEIWPHAAEQHDDVFSMQTFVETVQNAHAHRVRIPNALESQDHDSGVAQFRSVCNRF